MEQTGGKLTHFVGGIGTGGAITGIGKRLKEYNPNIQVVAIIPEEFPGVEGLKPLGSPDAIVPAILDQSVIDYRVDVSVESAYDVLAPPPEPAFCRSVLRRLYAGVYTVAKTVRSDHIVTLFNDLGERYASTHLWSGMPRGCGPFLRWERTVICSEGPVMTQIRTAYRWKTCDLDSLPIPHGYDTRSSMESSLCQPVRTSNILKSSYGWGSSYILSDVILVERFYQNPVLSGGRKQRITSFLILQLFFQTACI